MDNKSRGRPDNPKYEKVKNIVADLHGKNPTWSPRRIHIATSESILKSLSKQFPTWKETDIKAKAQEYLPSKSWIRDYLKGVVTPNIKKTKDSGLDTPWHLGLMAEKDKEGNIKHPEYNISPEAVPYIENIQNFIEKFPDTDLGLPWKPLTIRQVLWAARLYRLSENYVQAFLSGKEGKRIAKKENRNADYYGGKFLLEFSIAYADAERIATLSGTELNTTELDKSLRNREYPLVGWKDADGNPSVSLYNLKDSTVERMSVSKFKKEGAE